MAKAPAKQFDYGALEDKDQAGRLRRICGYIRRATQEAAGKIIETGRLVADAHKELAGDGRDGLFAAWIEAECGFSRATAYRLMGVFESFGKCLTVRHFQDSALYLLSSSSTPKNATREAIRLAGKGTYISHEVAKDLVKKHKERVAQRASSSGGKGSVGDAPSVAQTEAEEAPADPYDRCPNCGSDTWTEDDDGWACAKCHHPYGEPAGEVDKDSIKTQRQKTVKTVEALMRAFDDLHHLVPKSDEHTEAMANCKFLLTTARGWK